MHSGTAHKQNKTDKIEKIEEAEGQYYAKYIGGHYKFPKPSHTNVWFYPTKLIISPLNLQIPYSSISNVKLVDHDTAIRYHDGQQDHTIGLDFESNTKYAYPLIQTRVRESRYSPPLMIKSDKPSLSVLIEIRHPKIILTRTELVILVNLF